MTIHSAPSIHESLAQSILVVDDDPQLRLLYRNILESRGYLVSTAPDAEEALARYGQALNNGQVFDLVLLDVCMPGMDGLECARRILSLDACACILVTTGHCPEDMHGMVGNLAGVLNKPVSLKVLLREISACISGAPRPVDI